MTDLGDSHLRKPAVALQRLLDIMATLRSPTGCSWDAKQTPESLKPFIIEEAYEVLDAIDSGQPRAICEELGDLLLQIVFQASIFEERGAFSMTEVATTISEKLVRRHPHVFDDRVTSPQLDLDIQWETIKAREKQDRGEAAHPLGDLPRQLPALQAAGKLAQKLDQQQPAINIPELHKEITRQTQALLALRDPTTNTDPYRQIGQLLFSLVRFSQRLGIDAEQALRAVNHQTIANYRANPQAPQQDS